MPGDKIEFSALTGAEKRAINNSMASGILSFFIFCFPPNLVSMRSLYQTVKIIPKILKNQEKILQFCTFCAKITINDFSGGSSYAGYKNHTY
jgi:hypothetical protein